MIEGDFRHLYEALEGYGNEVRNLYQDNLVRENKIASGELLNSVEFSVRTEDTAYVVSLRLADYWKYVEGGTKGTESSPAGAVFKAHFPPVSALLSWIQVKPVLPRPDDKGRIPTPQQLAYLIGRKIERFGIEPAPALQKTLDELNAVWLPKITEAFARDCGEMIRRMTFDTFAAMTA